MAAFLALLGLASASQSVGAQSCLDCHESEGMVAVFEDGTEIDVAVDPAVFAGSVHAQLGFDCQTCHVEIEDYPHPELPPTARQWRIEQQQVCAWCHSEGEDFDLGAHGRALTRGDPDVPDCTTCHGDAHAIVHEGTRERRTRMVRVCASCHGDDELMEKHGVRTGTVSTYLSEFHGLTARLLQEEGSQMVPVAVCADCHGAHRILPASDPSSTVYITNLSRTCRRCHPDATQAFATAWSMHRDPESHPLVRAIAWFYRALIATALLGFAGYIGLELRHRRRNRWRPGPGRDGGA